MYKIECRENTCLSLLCINKLQVIQCRKGRKWVISQDHWETKDFLGQIKDFYPQGNKQSWKYYKQLREMIKFAFLHITQVAM